MEEELELAEELLGEEAIVALDEVAEEMSGEQSDRIREETEEKAHEEVRDLLLGVDGSVGMAALLDLQTLSQTREDLGRFLGDMCVRAVGTQSVCIVEEGAEDFEWRQRALGGDLIAAELVEVELVDALLRGGEVGVDLESIEVADDEEGRIAEVFAVIVELLVGCLEVLVFLTSTLLVLPGEVIPPPDIGESIAAVDLGDGLFEGEAFADAVGRGWVGRGRACRRDL